MEIEKLKEDLKVLGKRVVALRENITTEEATKTSIIMPFFQMLGYDIFNPTEFVPEFTADVGIKKGEKVDYAIVLDQQPAILIEAKSITEILTKHDSQLFRYFGTTTSKFGILTNGIEYKFFTDLDEANKMDSTPFLSIDITNIKEPQFIELAKFHKNNYDIDKITSSASELKYLNLMKNFLSTQANDPSEPFVKYITSEIYDGRSTKHALERFKPIVKKGLNQFILERVNEKLSAALNNSVSTKDSDTDNETLEDNSGINLVKPELTPTESEIEAFTSVKLALKDEIELEKLKFTVTKRYFTIIFDDNSRKWLFRMYSNNNGNIRLELNDDEKRKIELDSPLDILAIKETLVEIITRFI